MGLNKLDMVSAMALGMKEFKKHINNKDVAMQLKRKLKDVETDEFIDDLHKESINITMKHSQERKMILKDTKDDRTLRKKSLEEADEELLRKSMEIGVLIRAFFELKSNTATK